MTLNISEKSAGLDSRQMFQPGIERNSWRCCRMNRCTASCNIQHKLHTDGMVLVRLSMDRDIRLELAAKVIGYSPRRSMIKPTINNQSGKVKHGKVR